MKGLRDAAFSNVDKERVAKTGGALFGGPFYGDSILFGVSKG